MRYALTLLLLAIAARAEPATPQVHLKDGRVLYGLSSKRAKAEVVLQTAFGPLRVPADAVGDGTSPPPAPPSLRTRTTRWLAIEHDLADDRGELYADQLDAFFEWMVGVYGLDRDRVAAGAPYRLRVFRRREDFKRLQRDVAPDIGQKGQAFAEGVAGFYAPGLGRIYLWDAEGSYGGFHLEVAKHEATHLLNDLLSRQAGLRMPTWFDEGSATYFSMFVPGAGPEPEDHPGAYAQVLGELDAGRAPTSRELRGVRWENFLGREYSWGWALVRFLRRTGGGARWPAVLAALREGAPMGPVGDAEEQRFLAAAGFASSAAFDEAWHGSLRKDRPKEERAYVGTSPEVLKRIAALAKPTTAMARDFARIGVSLARVREAEPAIVYLRAALRGGATDPEVSYELARALAHVARAPDDAPWPGEAVAALREAADRAPLKAAYRLALGRQLLARGETDAAYGALGLALVVAGSWDDDLACALGVLRAAAARDPEASAEDLAAALAEAVPPAAPALRTAAVYWLQETEDFEQLGRVLEARVSAGGATAEERGTLAGLYRLTDRLDEALAIYRGLVDEGGLHAWPDVVECLAAMGRTAESRAALSRATKALADAPPELQWVRRRLERLR